MSSDNEKMTRRQFIRKTGVYSFSALSFPILNDLVMGNPSPATISVAKNPTVSVLVETAIKKLGGMKKFVNRGDVVLLKPNCAFNSSYKIGANTNPYVVKKIAELCMDAGAKKVRIFDRAISDQQEAFKLSGMKKICEETGFEFVKYSENRVKKMNLKGVGLKKWPVVIDCVECDKLINVPIAKTHSIATLTMGMKNWFGAIGGPRWQLHMGIDECIVDLAKFFNPALTVIDATRIMVRNGPHGGSYKDIKKIDTIVAGKDYVACDAYATTLFNMKPENIKYITLAGKLKHGQAKLKKIRVL